MQDAGICVILALIGVFLTAVLVIKNVKGNILWGILGTWILGIICQFTGCMCRTRRLDITVCFRIFQRVFPCRAWHRSL